jgi:hypothetical protein
MSFQTWGQGQGRGQEEILTRGVGGPSSDSASYSRFGLFALSLEARA